MLSDKIYSSIHLFIALALIGLAACSEPEVPETPMTFSGSISNGEADTAFVYNKDKTVKLLIDSNQFSDTLDLEEGYYKLKIGSEYTDMYWDSAYQIEMSVDMNAFDESISYSGYGSAENNYLAEAMLMKANKVGRDLFVLTEGEFLDSASALRDQLKNRLNEMQLHETFKKDQMSSADFDYNRSLYQYPNYHPYYSSNDTFELSESFFDHLIDFEKTDEATYRRSSSYRDLIMEVARYDYGQLYHPDSNQLDNIKKVIAEYEDGMIKDDILAYFSFSLMRPSEDLDKAYALLQAEVQDSVKLAEYEEAYNILKELKEGKPSPTFKSYENYKGGGTSLSELKGSYLYIDVWATWCGPCIREIPALKALEEKYEDENIQFVSISVDAKSDHDKWKAFVNDRELGGVQLFAPKSWKSEFIKNYHIRSIPRFILIDPEGNIIDADAKRPSDEELSEQLDDLMKEGEA